MRNVLQVTLRERVGTTRIKRAAKRKAARGRGLAAVETYEVVGRLLRSCHRAASPAAFLALESRYNFCIARIPAALNG